VSLCLLHLWRQTRNLLARTSSEEAVRGGVSKVKQVNAAVKVDVKAHVGANGEGRRPEQVKGGVR
jgi:hypothetical protein